ncbi:hypothetical protein TNCV_4418761 [Trichonephila clavipes]|nr:hypothetical protein TNCV_4418761 [Trichonephila clavipes]
MGCLDCTVRTFEYRSGIGSKVILAFVQWLNIMDANSDDEEEINNAAPVPTSSKMRNIMKSRRNKVKSASQAELQGMAKNGFQKCFGELYKRWSKCAVAEVSYFEEGLVSAT